MTAAQDVMLAATRTRDIVIVVVGMALAAACHINSNPPRTGGCDSITLNHSGVLECHLDGPMPAPPVTFMAVDTSSHLEL